MQFQLVDITGNRYGRLVVIKHIGKRGQRHYWLCQCDCGKTKEIAGIYLSIGETKSCGCFAIDSRKQRFKTHGHTNTRLYNIWCSMIQRCEHEKCLSYARYGSIGIRVCDEWRNDFMVFYNWSIQNGYKKTLSIDRYPNQMGDYEPNNCRWATDIEQARNQKTNKVVTIDGVSKCVSEWSEISGIPAKRIYNRLSAGWDSKDAIYSPKVTRLKAQLKR